MEPLRRIKPAAWLSLAIYLVASGFGMAHGAEFGDDVHKHNGHDCAIQYFVEEVEHGLLAQAPVTPVPVYTLEALSIAGERLAKSPAAAGYQSRAPPVIS